MIGHPTPVGADRTGPSDARETLRTVEGMPASRPAPESAASWLRRQQEAALVQLLRTRPDLAIPAPSDLEVLGRRLDTPTSVHRVLESLDALAILVLRALAVLEAHRAPVTSAALRALFPSDRSSEVTSRLRALESLALVRSTGDGRLSIPSAVVDAVGPYPAGFGAAGLLTPAQARKAVAGLDDSALGLLRRLDQGHPRGTFLPDSPAAALAHSLAERSLLTAIDRTTVELPREVALALRGDAPLGVVPTAPDAGVRRGDHRRVDGTAAGEALATLRRMEALLRMVERSPATALKSGAVGIRELRRIARDLDVDDHHTSLLLELAAVGGLITQVDGQRIGAPAGWHATLAAEEFLERPEAAAWASLVSWWLEMRRDPSRTGERDESQKVAAPLSPELSWVRGPADRRFVLSMLAALPSGIGLGAQELLATFAWRAPMRSATRRESVARTTVTEGTWLGLLAFDALSSAGRQVLDGDVGAAATALESALPKPVDQVLIQADLTMVAPGRLEPAVRQQLEQVARLESAGSASVYRVTPDTLRGALDSGLTAADLHSLFAARSATGVPQGLTYLIDDTARRHGVLRGGAVAGYLRSDDPALISEAIRVAQTAGLSVRRLAPTVAVSSVDLLDLLEVLGDKGVAVATEDAAGGLVDLRPARPRARSTRAAPQPQREFGGPDERQLRVLVERMVQGDRVRPTSVPQTAAEAMVVLRRAAAENRSAWIGYVDAEGGTSRRMVKPVVVSGGMMVAHDSLRSAMRTFALHRITEAQLDDEVSLPPPP